MNVQILQDVAVSPNLTKKTPHVTCAYPLPCPLRNGDVLCAYRQGREKHSRDGILVAQRSSDGGASWSDPIVIYDGMKKVEPESVHTGALCEDRDGTVLAFFTTIEAKNPDVYVFSEQGRKLRQQLYVARSRDGGRTWASAEPCNLPGAPREVYIGSRPILLPNGELFLPIETTREGGHEVILASSSADGGLIWQRVWTCFEDPSGRISYGDPRFTLLPDGRIVALFWTWITAKEETLPVHRSVSEDGGRTWSAPVSTGVASQIMVPLALDAERMIAVSNVRTAPEGIRFWFSNDAGKSWNADSPIQMWDPYEERMKGTPLEARSSGQRSDERKIWESLPGFTFGNPDVVALDESTFLLTYYATVQKIIHVRSCRFRWA